MKILYLAKRRYMRHDLILDRYARLYELPTQLSGLGHDVLCICLSYSKSTTGKFVHRDRNGSPVRWYSFNAGPALVLGFLSYLYNLAKILKDFRPNVILTSSDVLHIILACILSRLTRTPYIADLYDNYESFGMTSIPGMRYLYRRSLRQAKLISVVSQPLHDYIKIIAPNVPVIVIESTVDPKVFHQEDKQNARQKLQLDSGIHCIGAAGELHRNRGIQVLYDAFMICVRTSPQLHLILAGKIDSQSPPPVHPNIIYIGTLPHGDMPTFYSALDVAIIPMIDTDFGRYAFPQKAYEIMSCMTPVVAANVGPLKHTLRRFPVCLYDEGNAQDLSKKILSQLAQPVIPDIDIPSWKLQGERLEKAIYKHILNQEKFRTDNQ